ncbi:hypothetical protein SALBM311S_01651 [Streptomyces alboniger]
MAVVAADFGGDGRGEQQVSHAYARTYRVAQRVRGVPLVQATAGFR